MCLAILSANAETSKGFGFVEYEDPADAKEAMENMDGTCVAQGGCSKLVCLYARKFCGHNVYDNLRCRLNA